MAGAVWVLLPFGPLLAALIVTAAVDGRQGLRELGSRLLRWRVGGRWYVVAIGLPLAVVFSAIGLNLALGAPPSALAELDPWYLLVLVFAVRLVNPLDGPMGEEPGWRGFALPRLQAEWSPLIATLILALLVVGWHLPLLFLPGQELPAILLLATVATTFLYTWIFNHTRGSVLMTLVAHAAEGTITLGAIGFVGADLSRFAPLYAAAWCAVALALVVFDRRHWLDRAPAVARSPGSVGQPIGQ